MNLAACNFPMPTRYVFWAEPPVLTFKPTHGHMKLLEENSAKTVFVKLKCNLRVRNKIKQQPYFCIKRLFHKYH